jgi:CelD/BcsL family acetyltransferase involved in cellulose biosynthesis
MTHPSVIDHCMQHNIMEVITLPGRDIWESIVRHSRHATFFHTPAWATALESTYPAYRNNTRAFIFESGSRAILPLMVEKESRGLFKKAKHKSMPLGVYGGIVSDAQLTADEREAIFRCLAASDISDLKVVAAPLEDQDYPESFKRTALFTHLLYLERNFDRLASRFSRGQKSNIKQARKKGVTVRTAGAAEDCEHYLRMYQDTLKRWGAQAGVRYPRELFLNLLEAHNPDIRLWLAEKEAQPIAGVIALYCNETVLYWHGCSLQDYFDHYPNNLIHAEIIRDACERGYARYDLSPSGGYEGVIKFKDSFSAKRVDINAYHWKKKAVSIGRHR